MGPEGCQALDALADRAGPPTELTAISGRVARKFENCNGRLRIHCLPDEHGFVELDRSDLGWLPKFMDGTLSPMAENARRQNPQNTDGPAAA